MQNSRTSVVNGSSGTTLPQPKLSGFIILDRLGAGTYGSVYKSRQQKTNQLVAVKCISRKTHGSREAIDNILLEIELLKKLRHPHIVELLDFTCDENYVYIVMELCDGGDLSQFIRQRQRLSERIVRRFLQQLASALQFLSENRIIHADLKPSNILLTRGDPPRLKLADFGFAKHLGPANSEESDTILRGSLLYMAPEVLRERRYSEKCDLWSLGVILFECLFGRAPYASATRDAVAQKVAAAAPILLPVDIRISEACSDCLARLLQPDPANRMTMAEFLAHSFVDLAHVPTSRSWSSAMELIASGHAAEEAKSFEQARVAYTKAVSYLLPLLHFEGEAAKKQQIRSKLLAYMERAELLRLKSLNGVASSKPKNDAESPSSQSSRASAKLSSSPTQSIVEPSFTQRPDSTSSLASASASTLRNRPPKPTTQPARPHSDSLSCYKDLLEVFDDEPEVCTAVQAAVRSFESAQRLVDNDELDSALVNYEQALDCLMIILRGFNANSTTRTNAAHKKELLVSTIDQFMSKAERVKVFVKQQKERKCEQQLAEEEREQLEFACEAKALATGGGYMYKLTKCSVM